MLVRFEPVRYSLTLFHVGLFGFGGWRRGRRRLVRNEALRGLAGLRRLPGLRVLRVLLALLLLLLLLLLPLQFLEQLLRGLRGLLRRILLICLIRLIGGGFVISSSLCLVGTVIGSRGDFHGLTIHHGRLTESMLRHSGTVGSRCRWGIGPTGSRSQHNALNRGRISAGSDHHIVEMRAIQQLSQNTPGWARSEIGNDALGGVGWNLHLGSGLLANGFENIR